MLKLTHDQPNKCFKNKLEGDQQKLQIWHVNTTQKATVDMSTPNNF